MVRVKLFPWGGASKPLFLEFEALPRVGDEVISTVWKGGQKGVAQVVEKVVWTGGRGECSLKATPNVFLRRKSEPAE
jgi:hypothetical protein